MTLYSDIMAGDTVYFKTPHTAELKGKAVMYGPHGWVAVSYTHLTLPTNREV